MEWLSHILESMTRIFPRLTLVRIKDGAVRFGRKGSAVELTPGLHLWWPLIHSLEVIPIARNTINLPTQTLLTADDVPVIASAIAVYTIFSARKALAETDDFENTIQDIMLVAAITVLSPWKYKTETIDFLRFNAKLTKICRAQLKPYGVHVIKCAFTDLAPCRVIRNVQGS